MLNRATPKRLTFIVIALLLGILLGLAFLPSGNASGQGNSGICDTVSEIPLAECQALESLYASTNGAAWIDSSGWLETSTPCTWNGISCAAHHVTRIEMVGNGLQGPLPGAIGDFSSLQALILANNALTGPLPTQLGQLANLTRLNLSSNQLSGAIPLEIGNLIQLRELSLAYNGFTGSIPTQIGQMSNLQTVELISNTLDGPIPTEIGNLNKLEWLDLTDNMLTGTIPTTLNQPPLLGFLFAEGNQLEGGVPEGLCDNLDSTTLSYNKLDPLLAESCLDASGADNWENTQTLPPADLVATISETGTIELSWTIVANLVDLGYYQIFYSETSGGPYTVHGQTTDKISSSYTIDDLDSSSDLFFMVRTVTPPHDRNQNELISEDSLEAPSHPNAIAIIDFSAGPSFPPLGLSLAAAFILLLTAALFALLKRQP